jgi:hypothetical protein
MSDADTTHRRHHRASDDDPSTNVKALTGADAKRQDDLRKAERRFLNARLMQIEKMAVLRAKNAEVLRTSDLDRLDKTRQVDVLAASASAATLATAVQTLASTADRNADALRNLVNATAATMAKQTSDQAATLSAATDSLVKDINSRIAELQKSSYQGGGKSEGMDSLWKVLVVGAGLLLAFLTYQSRAAAPDPTLAAMLSELKASRVTAAAAPQVIYVPAPAGALLPTTPPSTVPR